MSRSFSSCFVAAMAAMLFAVPAARGEQQLGGIGFSGSGFLTMAVGKVIKGDMPQDFNGYSAPMYVADYAQGGIYEHNGWTIKPDSKLGFQGTMTVNPRFSATAQVVSRGTKSGGLNLEWAYGSYVINDKLTFQFGRKRLPLFYYSETQDVGLTYPWIHLPPGQYGWEIVNYNGANMLYRDQWGEWTSSMNFFAGDETRKDNPYQKIYNGRFTRTDSKWSNIRGVDMTLTHDWFEARAAYIQSGTQDRFEDPETGPPFEFSPKAKQKIYSLSFSADHRNWVVINEYLYLSRKQVGDEFFSVLLGVGYRMGKYLPMVTYNRYRERLTPGDADPSVTDPATIDPKAHEGFWTLGYSLRYSLTPTSAIKVELDRWYDQNGPNFNIGAGGSTVPYGNARLFSVSYDMVF